MLWLSLRLCPQVLSGEEINMCDSALSFRGKVLQPTTMALSAEFVNLVEQEIPEGRQSLSDSHANLEKVAAYCIENFARVRMASLGNGMTGWQAAHTYLSVHIRY